MYGGLGPVLQTGQRIRDPVAISAGEAIASDPVCVSGPEQGRTATPLSGRALEKKNVVYAVCTTEYCFQ